MKVFVTAKPKSRKEGVEKVDETHLVVAVKEPPVDGAANAAIVRALADYYHVPVSCVKLHSGFSSRQKVFEIPVLN